MIFVYITLVCVLGIAAAWKLGRLAYRVGLGAAILPFLFAACLLGYWLTFPLPVMLGRACDWAIGIRECIRTTDQTVWLGVLPLVLTPVYAIVMCVARALRKRAGEPALPGLPGRRDRSE